MHLSKLFFTNLGPFDEIEFDFDEHVNVFAGPNNSGKSTVLLALGEIAVYPFSLPEKLLRAKAARFRVELGEERKVFENRFPIDIDKFDDIVSLMTRVGYSSFVPAIRLSTDFRARVPTVPNKRDATDNSTEESEELRKRERLIHTYASSISDEAVVQKIIELDYRAYRRSSPTIRNIIDKTVAIASEITEGYSIRFVRVDEDKRGLFPQFVTPDGLVPLNVLSQGTQSLVQWLAHLLIGMAEYYDYPKDIENESGILIIDEIDAHLHPSWQRGIIPALTKHFPNIQIFCSTHSPLMLAGLKAGQVQLLERDEHGKVTVSRNEQDIVGWSADEILRSFLDVPSPTDLETVQNIERLQELRQIDGLTDEQASELNRLRETVRRDLIGGPLATELDELRSILNESTRSSSPNSPSQ
ncbi:MAG: AAA family ATPase [Dehalococcoidia bacterium]|nr:AAA family ATPase [Dehalococcoidia bacterium]